MTEYDPPEYDINQSQKWIQKGGDLRPLFLYDTWAFGMILLKLYYMFVKNINFKGQFKKLI